MKAIVTGASGGIGLEIARQLAEYNYKVTMVARSEERLTKAVASLSGSGHQLLIADLTDIEEVNRIAEMISVYKFDVLINNAGGGNYGQFTNITLQDHLNTMQLNMNALVTLSHSFLKTAVSGDALINVGSMLALSSLPGGAVYAGTKSFVANFSESLWYEYKPKGIFVMGFNPGAAKSDFHLNAGKQTSDFPEFVLSSTQEVANELVAALRNRSKPRVIQGWKNRLMLFGFKFLNRKTAVNIMGKISPGLKS